MRAPTDPAHADLTDETLYHQVRAGDVRAFDVLYGRYEGRLFGFLMRMVRNHHDAEDLLHEAFINMSERDAIAFPDRARFMAYAARAMRGLIIDHARSRHAQKRGGQFEMTTLDTNISNETADSIDLPLVGDALDELAKLEPDLAQVVDLKFFCGFTFAEIAAMRGVSERTVQRDWEKARIYLHQSLRGSPQ